MVMQLEISLKKQEQDIPSKWAFVVQLLRSLEFVEFVELKGDTVIPTNNVSEFLLNGPTMNKEEERFYEQKNQHFNQWK